MKTICAQTVEQKRIFQDKKEWIVLRVKEIPDEELEKTTLGYIKTPHADIILRAYLLHNKDLIHWIARKNNEFNAVGVDVNYICEHIITTNNLAKHALIREYTKPSDAIDVLDDVKSFISDLQHKLAEKFNEHPSDGSFKCTECSSGIVREHDYKCGRCHKEFCSECGNLKHSGECNDVEKKSFQAMLEKTRLCPGCSMRITVPEGELVYCPICQSVINISSWKVKALGLKSSFVDDLLDEILK